MKIEKKDQPKLIVVAVLFVGALVYCVVQMTAAPTTQAASKSAGAPAGDAAGGASGTATPVGALAAAADPAAEAFEADRFAQMSGGKDPFVPNGPAAAKNTTAPPPVAGRVRVAATPPAPPLDWLGKPGKIPAAPPDSWGGEGAAGPDAPPVPPTPVAVPAPRYEVTGIVRGEVTVAILRSGEERRFVRAGDSVGNGFTVTGIGADGVEIQSGERRVTLKLGGDSREK